MPAKTAYTLEEKRQAMVIHVANLGRSELIEKQLAQAGLKVPLRTLRAWIQRDRDTYLQIKQEYEAAMRTHMAEGFYGTADLAVEVGREALNQMADALRSGEVTLKELPRYAQSAMIAAGVATDKGQLLSGQPTNRTETSIEDLKGELSSLGIQIVVGGAGGDKPTQVNVAATPALPSPAGVEDESR